MKSQSDRTSDDLSLLEYVLALGKDLDLMERDLQTLSNRHRAEGDSFLTITLPKLAKALERGLADGVFQLPTCFKRRFRRQELPAFCCSLFGKVFRRDGSLLDCPDVTAVYAIRQLCLSVNKVDLPYKEDLESAVIERFKSVEEEVEAYNHSSMSDDESLLLSIPNLVSRSIFCDFDISDIRPTMGPGVSSNVEFTRKYESTVSTGLRNTLGQSSNFWFNTNDAFTRLDRYPLWRHFDYFKSNLKARVILVPKDSRGPRLISCEPWENMYLQQGIMEYMVNRLESHPLTRGQINFTDQSVNQRLATEASLTRYWATLDLKDASDRISLKLVTHIFGGSPIFEALLSTRTPITELPDKSEVRLAKFAPMGSALCFPVMAYCLWTIVVARLATHHRLPIDEARKLVFVYGDDLILPSSYASDIISTLERYCLRVNKEKSFINSNFAESCGRDAYLGNDVTPTRLRKCRQTKDPTSIQSLVSTAQLLSQAGLLTAAELLYSTVEQHIGRLPFGLPTSPYLCRYTTRTDTVPEQNMLSLGRRHWKNERDRSRYPLGRSLIAWTTRPVTTLAKESMFGRFMRTWRQVGRDFSDDTMPAFGEFPRSRTLILVKGKFDHYAMA